jgi:hypothetical protein
MIEKIVALLLGEAFKKKPWALWAIKPDMKAWKKIGQGSMRRLRLYEKTMFVEGWRTLIVGTGITPEAPPKVFHET